MKRFFIIAIAAASTLQVSAQTDTTRSKGLGGLFKKAGSVLGSSKSGTSLSTDEIVAGLKEALSLGAQQSASKLSSVDGFLKDAAVKVLLPEDVKKVESKLRLLGMGKIVDQAITSMNRAAEEASKTAAPIFVNAVKKMTITDALSILKGNDTSATSYLKRSTTNELTNTFRPIVEAALKKVNATKYYGDLAVVYNKVAPKPVSTDLTEYVTDRAMSGMFYYIGVEEKKIRENPAARVTEILKKVFGAK